MLAAALLGVALGFTCVNCALGTSGSCKDSASGMCWTFLPGGSICPQPASPCDATGNVPRFVSNLDSDGFPLYPPLPSRAPIATPCPVKQSVAYFPSPFSIWRPNSEHLQTTGINSALFSHGVYFAAQINPTPPFSVYYAADREMAVVNNFLLAVRQNPCAKAIVSIATYNFDRAPNSRLVWMGVATVPAYRKAFVDSAIMFARKTGFDGIELVRFVFCTGFARI